MWVLLTIAQTRLYRMAFVPYCEEAIYYARMNCMQSSHITLIHIYATPTALCSSHTYYSAQFETPHDLALSVS